MMETAITILIWIGWGMLALVGTALLLIHLPYRASVRADWGEDLLDARAFVGWPFRLFGLMADVSFEAQRVSIYLMGLRLKTWSLRELKGGKPEDAEKREQKKRKKEQQKKKQKKRGAMAERIYLTRMPHKAHALKQVSRWLSLSATLQGRFGFDDPYATGQLAMALVLVRTVFPSFGQKVVLDYIDPACEGRLNLSMMVWLPRIELGITAFLLSRQGRDMVRYYWARPKPAHGTV